MKPTPTKLIGYMRTSTDDQLLGIEAQEKTLSRIESDRKCPIVRTYIEHESGGDNTRVELDKAIRHARRINAYLVVAKLDRLSRDGQFLLQLYNGDVLLIFGDLPEVDGSAASRLMVHMMAGFAEFERKRIGERTKEALAQLKARGVKLGTPANLTPEARLKGSQKAAVNRRAKAISQQSDIAEIALTMRKETNASLRQIAAYLNKEGYACPRGGRWSASQVGRVMNRLPNRGNPVT